MRDIRKTLHCTKQRVHRKYSVNTVLHDLK